MVHTVHTHLIWIYFNEDSVARNIPGRADSPLAWLNGRATYLACLFASSFVIKKITPPPNFLMLYTQKHWSPHITGLKNHQHPKYSVKNLSLEE